MKRYETMATGMLAALAAFSLYMGIKSLFLDGYLGEYLLKQESLNMIGELFLIFLWNLFLFSGAKQRRWKAAGAAAMVLLFLWLHQSFLPVLAAGMYTLYLLALGYTAQKAVGYSCKGQDKFSRLFISYLLGSGIWITVVCTFSAFGLGGIRLYRTAVLISFALLMPVWAAALLFLKKSGSVSGHIFPNRRKMDGDEGNGEAVDGEAGDREAGVRTASKQPPASIKTRACLKIHFRHLHVPLCGIFDPNSVNVAHYASLIRAKSPTKWNAQLTKSNFQTHSRPEGLFWALIITMCLLQIGRMNIAMDYDSLHYGLRSLYILDNGAGIYENLGTVNQVYTYSKGFEVLSLPLSGTSTYGYVLAFNMWVCIGSLIAVYAIVRKLSSGWYGMLAAAILSCIPGVMNMGITAKSDCITLLFQLFFIYFLISYLEEGEVHHLIFGGCACLMTYIYKPTSMVFSTVLIGMSVIWLVTQKRFCIWKKSRAWLLTLPAVAAWLFLWARTYILTGYPVTSVFTSIWDRLGFQLKYPFSFFDIPDAGGKLLSLEGMKHLSGRIFHMLFAPSGDDMFHVRIAWGTGLMAFLLGILLLGFFRRRGQKEGNGGEERKAPVRCLYAIFLPLMLVCIISIRLLWQVDGNYFMLFYAMLVILSVTELSYIRRPKPAGKITCMLAPLLAFNIVVTCLTNWSGTLGLTPVRLVHKGYYNHLEENYRELVSQGNQDIWNQLSANPRTRVLAMGEHPKVLAFPCNVQSYYDVTGSGGNVFLVKTLDNFKKFLRYAKTEYIYVQSGYLKSGSRVRDIVRYMLEDNSLAEIKFEGGNMLGKVNLDGIYQDNPNAVLEEFYRMYPSETEE